MFLKTKSLIKEWLYRKLNISYGLYGLPIPLIKYLNKNHPISLIDIGAHDGYFTSAIENYCGVSQGLLVEPLPHKADSLRKKFCSPEYSIFECVLSQSIGTVNFEVNEAEATSSLLNIKRSLQELSAVNLGQSKIIQCQARTLDHVVAEHGFQTIDLIKLDVQGAEHLVLAGGKKSLEMSNLIWTEVSFRPLYEDSSIFFDIYSLLNQANFRLMELSPGFRAPNGELLQADALFIKL